MTSRRRSEDSIRLYDFAKIYQENQNSSDMVKKQNATEEKVLSARLEYLNNQKELAKKTMEKEIDLVQRNSLSARETSGKSRMSYQMNRAVSMSSIESWRRENLFEKCERCLLLATPQSPSKESKPHCCNEINSKDDGECCVRNVHSAQSSKQRENLTLDSRNNEKETGSSFQETTFVMTGNSTRVGSEISKNSSPKRQTRNFGLNTSASKTKLCFVDSSTPRFHLTNDGAENVERNGRQMKQNCCRAQSHYLQALEARREAWARTPTPFPRLEREKSLINGTLVHTNRLLADGRNNQLRFSRTMPRLSHTPTSSRMTKCNPTGVATNDLRFKKLESLLVAN